MKKIGIITLCGNNNYGNKLQNYAIVKTLEQNGYDPETIWIYSTKNGIKSNLGDLYWQKKQDIIVNPKRSKMFKCFNKYLNIKKHVLFEKDIHRVAKKYDALLVGSDQVWNPDYFTNNSVYLLTGIKKKKISFSASFGVNNIPENRKNDYRKGLLELNAISVREERGKELVKELSGRKDAEVLIDPTMLLAAEEWDKIAKKPVQVPKKYVLNYFLGYLTDDRKEAIEKLAKERNCEIINILDKNGPFYNTGPSEFLYLEKHAELVCTDSFHSCVFAIIFNRPFVVFDRIEPGVEKMNSRIETLLRKFNLKDRAHNNGITDKCFDYNYTEAYKILETEKKKSIAFLRDNLK